MAAADRGHAVVRPSGVARETVERAVAGRVGVPPADGRVAGARAVSGCVASPHSGSSAAVPAVHALNKPGRSTSASGIRASAATDGRGFARAPAEDGRAGTASGRGFLGLAERACDCMKSSKDRCGPAPAGTSAATPALPPARVEAAGCFAASPPRPPAAAVVGAPEPGCPLAWRWRRSCTGCMATRRASCSELGRICGRKVHSRCCCSRRRVCCS
mmetsp:Transcript_30858/g.98442  ORF Transcript_30858/g.98442 Transcript_30858/m.98442 type:complete len:216 (-) Transcript_30858:1107-1754(-)